MRFSAPFPTRARGWHCGCLNHHHFARSHCRTRLEAKIDRKFILLRADENAPWCCITYPKTGTWPIKNRRGCNADQARIICAPTPRRCRCFWQGRHVLGRNRFRHGRAIKLRTRAAIARFLRKGRGGCKKGNEGQADHAASLAVNLAKTGRPFPPPARARGKILIPSPEGARQLSSPRSLHRAGLRHRP